MLGASLTDARKNGWKWYYTGKPCKRGHVAPRLASSGRCGVCHKMQKANFRKTEKHRQWKRDYDKRYSEKNLSRSDRIKQATPLWADVFTIKNFYLACPDGMHVDHIIPLGGEFICWLHTLENLQYLPAEDNLAKGNAAPEIITDFAICEISI